jgi:hypothetical protein
MYVFSSRINGNVLPSLSPNGYSPESPHFDGYLITGDILREDFWLSGYTYFDGGGQTGDANTLQFTLKQVSSVPEPSTVAVLVEGLLLLAFLFHRNQRVNSFSRSQDKTSDMDHDRSHHVASMAL